MSVPPHADRHHRRLPAKYNLHNVEKGFQYNVHTINDKLKDILVSCGKIWRCVDLKHFAHTTLVQFETNTHNLDILIPQITSKIRIEVLGEGVNENITVELNEIWFTNRSKAPVDSDASDNDMHVDSDASENDIAYASEFMTDSDAESVDLALTHHLNF